MRIRKGDTVKILKGKDRGKQGKVVKVLRPENRVVIEKVNVVKKHKKKTGQDKDPGGIFEIEAPISVANVMLVCPECSKPTRIGIKIENKNRYRVCKNCKKLIN